MANRRRPTRRPKAAAPRPRSTTPRTVRRPSTDGEPELLTAVRTALRTASAYEVLSLVSTFAAVLDPRSHSPFDRPAPDAMTLAGFAQLMIGMSSPESSAVLAGIAVLTDDDVLTTRIRRELGTRPEAPPSWLTAAARAEVVAVQEMVEELGGGENVLLGVRLPTGEAFCLLTFVDHNLGSVVKDAFVIPGTVERVAARMREAGAVEEGLQFRRLDPADARARLTAAIARGAQAFPPLESDTWPQCRPLFEWAARLLPDGGHAWHRHEWTKKEQQQLVRAFLASSHGREFAGADDRSLLESILWYGTDYSTLDPLRWGVPKLEVLMFDWVPRKIVADVPYLDLLPALLRAYVAYAHERAGVRADLTRESVQAIDAMTPQYRDIVRDSSRPQGPAALLAAMGRLPAAEPDDDGPFGDSPFDMSEFGSAMRLVVARSVGGEDALDRLDDAALPDEAFDWIGVAEDVRPVVCDVLDRLDSAVEPLLGVDYRTVCRRLLRLAALGDPAVFRRKGNPATSAAAICWLAGKANDLFGERADQMLVKDLLPHFGVGGSVSQRARALLGAAGFEWSHNVEFGTAALLTAAHRRRLIKSRDRYDAWTRGE